MADIVKFVSQSVINAKKEQKRKAREETIRRAKDEYEREEQRREKREESGESSWMLASVSQRVASDDEDTILKKKKSKKEKKLKKAKKHKKKQQKKPKDEASPEELESGDEWVEKSVTIAPVADLSQTTQVQRDSWMLCPPISNNEKSSFEEELVGDAFKGRHPEREEEKEDKKLSCIDQPGQHPKELNPYWKDGGVGVPSEERQSSNQKKAVSGPGKGNWDISWLRKSYQRAKEQAEEEGGSVEEIVSQRWGSLERLETMIKEAEERAKREENTGRRREKDRSYDRDRGRDKGRDEDRYKGRDRDMDRGRYKDRDSGTDRNGDRDRYKDQDSERDRVGDRDRDRDRYKDRDSERDRDGDGDRDGRYKDRDSARDRNGDRDKDRYKDQDSGRDRDKDKDRDGRYKDRDSGIDRGKEQALDSRDKDRDRGKEFKERQSLFEKEKWQRRPEQEKTNTSTRCLRPSDTATSSSFVGTFKRPQSDRPATSSSSSSWDFSSPSASVTADKSHSRTAGGWRKKTAEDTSRDNEKSDASESRQMEQEAAGKSSSESEGSSSSEGDEGQEDTEQKPPVVPQEKITEAVLNQMGADILRAELMGDEEQASKLKLKIEQMRKHKEIQESQGTRQTNEERKVEEIVLTRTDRAGNTRPVEITTRAEPSSGRRRKRKKMATHSKEGERERYFADDDRYDLKEMVRREKMSTAEDQDAMMARLSSKAAKVTDADYFTLDDHFESSASTKFSAAQQEERERQKAIAEHRKMAAQLSRCRFCFENPDISKHLIIAIGIKVYLAVPLHQSLTEGHCLIIPMQHSIAGTFLDEDVWSEVQIFKKGLTKMFEEMEQDVVFLETCKQIKRQHHMIIECVPLPKEEGSMAPIYFKKAILESDTEWAQNQKLVDTRKKGLRSCIPKGLPYFSVEFGMDGGFAHVIEDEELFPYYFGKEIVGGMMDIEPQRWRKPRKENFEEHKTKVIQFGEWWKSYDWTQRLEKNK